jgi:shikimate kinase
MSSRIRHVVMLGLMGVGKTTIGSALGHQLGWPVSDSDRSIEEHCGATVRELKDRLGTDGMHRLEAEHLLDALHEDAPSVICAAASVVDVPECRRALEGAGAYGVWLQGRAETLAERFAGGPHRPVYGADPEAVFRSQLGERSRWFAEVARHRVSVDGRTPVQIVRDILAALGQAGVRGSR